MIFLEITPFARANLMYSESRTSSIEDLTRRRMPAAGNQPSVTAGNTKCFQVPEPDVGNRPNITLNSKISMIPSQNPGIAWPTRAMLRAKRSRPVPRVIADQAPNGTPNMIAKMYAAMASWNVASQRPPIIFFGSSLK